MLIKIATMEIKMISIAGSSMVARYGYDKRSETMRIDFHGSGMYDYFNVSNNEYKSIMAAESFGRQLKIITKGKRFQRVI